MSRRSVRLQARNSKQPLEEDQQLTFSSRKRKLEDHQKQKEENQIVKRHQYEIQLETTGDIDDIFYIDDFLLKESWGSSKDVWHKILKKESKYVHDKCFLLLHPTLKPNMRAILLDWLMEVCEVYTLHRETFYLAQDFFDRFMSTQSDISKNLLQLIGITCLFIASKLEEIYPPKLQEFAYVTDGACTEDDIVHMELIVLKALKWELCPVTIISWLNLYLQVDSLKDAPKVLLPQYSQETFIQIALLVDLCILDIDSLGFQYRILAAAALYHFTSIKTINKASGLDWDSIAECANWMAPFVKTVKAGGPLWVKDFKKVMVEDRHNIQTHTNYLHMLDEVNSKAECTVIGRQSPPCIGGILTPPKSTEKSLPC